MLSDYMQQLVQTYLLVVFRVAGMMLFMPFFGSGNVPRQVKALLCIVIASALVPSVPVPETLPPSVWHLAIGIGGGMRFGVAPGMVLSMVFISAQWAGDIIGQQMGLNLSEVFDPQFGAQGSVVSEMYFMLMLVMFLTLNGHHAVLAGLRDSFVKLPLLSIAVSPDVFNIVVGLLASSTSLAVQLAAPMLLTMLVVDLVLGVLGKTMPQFNLMTAGLSLRSAIGMVLLIVGLSLSSRVLQESMLSSIELFREACLGAF